MNIEIKKIVEMNRSMIYSVLIVMAVAVTSTIISGLVGMQFGASYTDVATVVSIITTFMGSLWLITCGILMFSENYKRSSHFSRTRKSYMVHGSMLYLGMILVFYLCEYLLQAFNLIISGEVAGDLSSILDNLGFKVVGLGFAGAIFLMSLGVLCGTLILHFGRVGFWILYGCFIFCMVVVPRTLPSIIKLVPWGNQLLNMPLYGQMALVIIVSAAIWSIGCILARKTSV